MDATASQTTNPTRGRPEGNDQIALVLQGGGALGAYQAGVYEALHEAELEPDWVAGVSIGAINAALIAGNQRENRLERLRSFWDSIITWEPFPFTAEGDDPQKIHSTWSSFTTLRQGQPNFFRPQPVNPWLSARGSRTATSFYNSAPLRETLLRMVDFDLLNRRTTRFACGAVNVMSGNFYYFDNHRAEILPEHVMASAALPPALPMVQIGTDFYWDGGLVSNTPLQHVLDHLTCLHLLVFQVDLFSALGVLPRDMLDVLGRQKYIQYSSRTRMVTDTYLQRYKQDVVIKQLLAKVPEDALTDAERALRQRLENLPQTTILHLIYQQMAFEGQAKDNDFSASSMREHWQAGYRDTQRTLRHKEWLTTAESTEGITVHDVHRAEREAR